MAIKINNLDSVTNILLIDSCPNILEIRKQSTTGNIRSKIVITVDKIAQDGQEMTINGNRIIGTTDLNKAFGNRFYISASDNYRTSVALVQSLNNISNLVKDYNIYLSKERKVIIEARQVGNDFDIVVTNDTLSYTKETTNSDVSTVMNNRYYIDVYNNDEYVTTISKINNNQKTDNIRFNLANVLQGESKYDTVTALDLNVYSVNGSKYNNEQVGYRVNVIKGYYANHGMTYLDTNEIKLPYNNNYYYYTCSNNIILSQFKEQTYDLKIDYMYSDESIIKSETIRIYSIKNKITFDEETFNKSYFINLTLNGYVIKLIRINPPYAQGAINRIYWHNSYGGINSFDFVGEKTIQRETDVTTYNTNDLDFYVKEYIGDEEVRNISLSEKVILTTHLMDDDKMDILEDLRLTKDAWIEEDGKKYKIIITNITYTKVNNNLSTANITYRYSLINLK